MFLIFGPADTSVFQEIDDTGDIIRDLTESVITISLLVVAKKPKLSGLRKTKVITTDGSQVIRLTGMSDTKVIVE